jgi:hypothetical protein
MRCAQPGWWIQIFALHTFQTPPERVFALGRTILQSIPQSASIVVALFS